MPLHPALVHLPIALVLFAPLFAAYIVREIARYRRTALQDSQDSPNVTDPARPANTAPPISSNAKVANDYARRRWRHVVVWAFVQTVLIYATMMTGENDADRVKAAVLGSPAAATTVAAIDAHENAASLLLLISGATLLAALIAWKPAPTARPWRLITIGVQLAALAVCLYTARLGGELVYKHGAAGAHGAPVIAPPAAPKP
ncbi:MAG: hypothetical protein NXI24_18935 [bacterium]|nr:hypothetical protein [bacterium]